MFPARAARHLVLRSAPMANKRERHDTILEIIDSRVVSSQEDLRKLLLQRGWDVTQATLSPIYASSGSLASPLRKAQGMPSRMEALRRVAPRSTRYCRSFSCDSKA